MRIIFTRHLYILALLATACDPAQQFSDSASQTPAKITEKHASDALSLSKSSPAKPANDQEAYPLLDWSALTPADWNAMALLDGIDLSNMEDDDPRAFELLKDVREQWNNAPINQALNGKAVTMHGYLVPLDADMQRVQSFLLVPYFGACIHSPPPPSNQTIYVKLPGNGLPLTGWDAFVSVSGTLVVDRIDSALAIAGYQMQADIVKPIAETVN